MEGLLVYGVYFGAVVGFLHAAHVVATQGTGPAGFATTLWRALWIFVLWTIFGTYVLALWLVGAVLLGLARAVAALRAPGRADGSEIRS